jgi:hypothetical protein
MQNLTPFQRQFYKSVTICELPFLYPTKIGQGLLGRMNEGNERAYSEYLDTLPKVERVNPDTGEKYMGAPEFTQTGYARWLTANAKSPALHKVMMDTFLIPDGHETRGGEVFDFMPSSVFEEISDFLLESLGESTPGGTQSPANSAKSTKPKTRAKVLKPR